jgi:hypothetical protein
VTGIVTFEFEAGAVRPTARDDVLDILVGVAENQVAAVLQVLPFPIVLECVEALQHGKQAEVHRPHVQGGHFGWKRSAGWIRSATDM